MRDLGGDTLLTASFYYNGAQGWFQLWDDPVAQKRSAAIRYRPGILWQHGHAQRGHREPVGHVGCALQRLQRRSFPRYRRQRSTVREHRFKETANAFGKVEYRLGQTLLFGDLQLRWAGFSYEGDVELGSVDWTFLDPKIGVRQMLSPGLSLYGSIGRAQREPARLDLLLGEDNATIPHDLEAVKPESMTNFEGGVNFNTPKLALQANIYLMEFRDEIALTGELSEIGCRFDAMSTVRTGAASRSTSSGCQCPTGPCCTT